MVFLLIPIIDQAFFFCWPKDTFSSKLNHAQSKHYGVTKNHPNRYITSFYLQIQEFSHGKHLSVCCWPYFENFELWANPWILSMVLTGTPSVNELNTQVHKGNQICNLFMARKCYFSLIKMHVNEAMMGDGRTGKRSDVTDGDDRHRRMRCCQRQVGNRRFWFNNKKVNIE